MFINDHRVSSLSRILNLLFSFASLETTQPFPDAAAGGPSFVAIQGKVYHRIRPTHLDSAVRWLLHDGFLQQNVPHHRYAAAIPAQWINALRIALMRVNSFTRHIRTLTVLTNQLPTAQLVLHDEGSTPEIAAIMVYGNTTERSTHSRDLYICKTSGASQKIPTVSRMWEPLSYPLLFPHGTLGWGIPTDSNAATADSCTITQMWHYRIRLLHDARFMTFGRLTDEYIVDMFSRDLETRLHYIRSNQTRALQEDAALMGQQDIEASENIYLPSSFLGSRRWSSQQIADSLTIAAERGNPSFFITMTCNPDWPEIQARLRPGQDFSDIPLIVNRVFKQKLTCLLRTLRHMFPNAGGVRYIIQCIEFQKRGLPHAHILIKYLRDCVSATDIDMVVSAEIPQDAADAALVRKFMLHHHPSSTSGASKYCQTVLPDGSRKCRFHYPMPLQESTTIDSEGRVHYRRRKPGDEMVVPYCLPLLRKFQCHINVEVASTSHLFQYIFKYIHKGQSNIQFCLPHHTNLPHLQGLTAQNTVLWVTLHSMWTRSKNTGMPDTYLQERPLGESLAFTSLSKTLQSQLFPFTSPSPHATGNTPVWTALKAISAYLTATSCDPPDASRTPQENIPSQV